MSLKPVYDKIIKIKNTPSSNDKVELLSKYLENSDFYDVIKLMYSEEYYYNINSLPKFKKSENSLFEKPSTNNELFAFLIKLSKQKGSSNEDKEKLNKLASIDQETHEVVKMIVNKDAKAGFSGKLINKAKKDTIYLIPYCRCSRYEKIENISFEKGTIVQEKANGMFVNIILSYDREISFVSRNGRTIHQLDHLSNLFSGCSPAKFNNVLMGELLVRKKDGIGIEDRKIGNGILNSCIQGTADPEDAKRVIILLWDSVPLPAWKKGFCFIPYLQRINFIKNFVKELKSSFVSVIETKRVFNLKDALIFFEKMISEHKEGAILKNLDMLWKFHTSTDAIKLKKVNEASLRVVGWAFGKTGTKFEKSIGALICESEEGKIKVNVSGLTDKDREIANEYTGKIIDVLFESIIKDVKKDSYSLYLPRFNGIRKDKNTADTFDEIQEKEKVGKVA